MHISDFDFELPENLIAQHPPESRGSSRLLMGLSELIKDLHFSDLIEYIQAGDVLVFNNTKVMKARLFGQKESGGKIEVLIERVIDDHTALAHIRSSKAPKPNTRLIFDGGVVVTMIDREDELFCLSFENELSVYEILEKYGHMPLPPYIERAADEADDSRFQTVYAKYQGAVAAPTAGLHFTESMLEALKAKGVNMVEVTLHVGAGTFQPVRVEEISQHKMHHEWYEVSDNVVAAIEMAKKSGHRVWAVGTTSMRALESAALSTGRIQVGHGDTDIFITPGYQFKVVDCLITNFHLPKSTLLMLVSAFAGMQHIKNIYQHAIQEKYRFFSYGDAMILGLNK